MKINFMCQLGYAMVPGCGLFAQSCPTLFDPLDCSCQTLCPWDFSGKSTEVGCHFLLQGIILTQASNPGLPHCRQTLYHLSHQGEEAGMERKLVQGQSINSGNRS